MPLNPGPRGPPPKPMTLVPLLLPPSPPLRRSPLCHTPVHHRQEPFLLDPPRHYFEDRPVQKRRQHPRRYLLIRRLTGRPRSRPRLYRQLHLRTRLHPKSSRCQSPALHHQLGPDRPSDANLIALHVNANADTSAVREKSDWSLSPPVPQKSCLVIPSLTSLCRRHQSG